jgi:Mrp family chromosome partitioning ATPase
MSRMLHALRQLEAKSESFAPVLREEPASDADMSWTKDLDEPQASPEEPLDLPAELQVAAVSAEPPAPAWDAEAMPSSIETAEAAIAAFDGLTALLGQTTPRPLQVGAPTEQDGPPAVRPLVAPTAPPAEASQETPEFVELPHVEEHVKEAPLDLTEALGGKHVEPAPPKPMPAEEPEAEIGELQPAELAPVVELFEPEAAVESGPPLEAEVAEPPEIQAVSTRRTMAPLEERILGNAAGSALTRQVGNLATAVEAEFAGATSAALLFVGADVGDHGALVAAHLGAALAAQRGGGVLLIDANSATRALSLGFGLNGRAGFTELLTDVCEGEPNAVYRSAVPDVSVLPAGRNVVLGAADLDARVSVLIRELGRQQRWILVHAGAAESSLTQAFCRFCDGVYLLVRLGQTTPEEAQRTLESLQNAGGRILGCIATNVPA